MDAKTFASKLRVADLTKKRYVENIAHFLRWLNGRKPSPETAQEYIDYLEKQGKKPGTVAIAANSLRAYFKVQSLKLEINAPKITIGEPKYLTLDQVKTLLEHCQTPLQRCLVTVLFDTGLRAMELLELKVKDIDFERGFLHVTRKGGREADVLISEKGLAALKEYLNWRRSRTPSPRVFMDWKYQDVYYVLKKLGRRAGIPDFTPHKLRHSLAVYMLDHGAELYAVQQILGHTSISTTANIYSRHRPAHLAKFRIPW